MLYATQIAQRYLPTVSYPRKNYFKKKNPSTLLSCATSSHRLFFEDMRFLHKSSVSKHFVGLMMVRCFGHSTGMKSSSTSLHK